jgi:hypothetical protein
MKNIQFNILWDWWDIALCIRFAKGTESYEIFKYMIDIQILWFDMWITIKK